MEMGRKLLRKTGSGEEGSLGQRLGTQHHSLEGALPPHGQLEEPGGRLPATHTTTTTTTIPPTPTPMRLEERRMLEAELEVENSVDAHHSTSIPAPTPYLDVPVLIQVIDTGDAAPIAVGIVNMPHIPQPVAWVTCHHGLAETETDGGGLLG